MYSILGTRSHTLPILTTTLCCVQETLNGRALTPVIDDPTILEALTPNQFLFEPTVLARRMLTDALRYVDCRYMYKVDQRYNETICQRWTKEYLPQCNVRAKWDRRAEEYLEVGGLVWLIDESVERHF